MKSLLAALFLALVFLSSPALAAPPATITYQGYLTDSSNAPVNTPVAMTLSLYSAPTGGAALWSEHQTGVPVVNGVYSLLIGSTTPITLPFDSLYYLGVAVDSDSEMTPRHELSAVPYSFRAMSADKISQVCADGETLTYSTASSSWSCANAVGTQGPQGTQGPVGATGPQGVAGPAGPAGPQGSQGATGQQGVIGLTGATGPQGPIGPIGSTGATGIPGATGLQGSAGPAGTNGSNGLDGRTVLNGAGTPVITGAAGAVGDFYIDTANSTIYGPKTGSDWTGVSGVALIGPQGPAGTAGAQGPDGIQGVSGVQGPIGLTGSTGPQGPIGLTGATGATGSQGTQGVAGPVGPAGASGTNGLNGADGSNGLDGRSVLNGAGTPVATGTAGVVGDFYIDTANNTVYGPKTGSDWVGIAGVSLIGPQGPTGAAGATGPQGQIGLTGTTGPQGPLGLTGATGPQGPDGASPFALNGVDAVYTAGSVGIGVNPPDATAVLDISSTTKGFLAPRMTDAEVTAITTPATGLLVYKTDGTPGFYYYNGSSWAGPIVTGSGLGTIAVANGGSGATSLTGYVKGNGSSAMTASATIPGSDISGNISGSAAGNAAAVHMHSGADISGNISGNATNVTGTVAITNGGTGATTQAAAANSILPTQTGNSGKLLGTDGTNASWVSAPAATYRWATFTTYEQSSNWAMNNIAIFFGGINPSAWTDGGATASMMSTDKEVLRTLYTNKGYAKKNALIMNEDWYSFSSTNGKVVTSLFRVNNATGSAIDWTPCFYYSAYFGWGERASVTLNGANNFSADVSGNTCLTLSIPAGRVSTAIFVSTSAAPGSSMRNTRLAFYNNSLDLPAGLSFVDDLDTATGGWEQ